MVKSDKGITLIALIITIVVMMILTFTVSVNTQQYENENTRANFQSDMESLKEEIDQYYARKKELPVLNRFINTMIFDDVKNANDDNEYYVIDIRELDVKLNYGADFTTIASKNVSEDITSLLDVYIINKQSHTIYYPKGVTYNGTVHYRLPEIYTKM